LLKRRWKINAVALRSVFDLLRVLSNKIRIDEEILDCARLLDRYYIPTRYSNSFESGSPHEYFTRRDWFNEFRAFAKFQFFVTEFMKHYSSKTYICNIKCNSE
jgi:HEPN domain-containing protein